MTIADKGLNHAEGALAGATLSSLCFAEYGADAPREVRIGFEGYEQVEGQITGRDGTGADLFASDMRAMAQAVPCFTPQTEIATASGLVAVADLRPGDRVITRDDGLQVVQWIGRRSFGWRALALLPMLRPVQIRAGALGPGLPQRDMIVSPNHRFLNAYPEQGESGERIIAARDLAGRDGIERLSVTSVDYVQILFDRHQLLLGEGCWSESYRPTAASLAVQPEEAFVELSALLGSDAESLETLYTPVRPLDRAA